MKRILAALLCMLLMSPSILAEENADRITLSFLGDCSIGDSIQYRDYDVSYHALLKKRDMLFPLKTFTTSWLRMT